MLFWYDYSVLIVTIAFSAFIGFYFGFIGRKNNTTRDYLFGGKILKSFPVGLSLAVSNFSSVTLTGVPADVYKYGSSMLWCFLTASLMVLIYVTVYLPVFFRLQVTSVLEYLKMRFDNRTRYLALVLTIIQINVYLPPIVYSTSLYFSTASGFQVHLVSLVVCGICVLYTMVGGLKAVIWTDIFQFAVTIASLASIFIIGLQSEGFSNIWEKAGEGGRLNLFDFDVDPTRRESFWSVVFGFVWLLMQFVGFQQAGIQKLLSLPKLRSCTLSLIFFGISYATVSAFCVLIGLTIYARYSDCDPFKTKVIMKHDQLVPYYISDITSNSYIPGINGLFISAIFSAALSTISSVLNASAGIIYNDFVCLFLKHRGNEKTRTNILKIIVFVEGMLAIALSTTVGHLGEMYPLILSINAISIGPLLGTYTLGVLFPIANATVRSPTLRSK